MNKNLLNYFIDFLMLILFIINSLTALIIFFFFDFGVKRGRYQEFLGISKGNLSLIHMWSGIFLIILIFLHIFLHWNLIICILKNKLKGGNKE